MQKSIKPYSSVWLERGTNNLKVVGSSPTMATNFFLKKASMADWSNLLPTAN